MAVRPTARCTARSTCGSSGSIRGRKRASGSPSADTGIGLTPYVDEQNRAVSWALPGS